MTRRRVAMVLGRSDAYMSQIWVDDAADAVVVAAARAPAGTFDVVDDAPMTRGALATAMALALGRRKLFLPPMWVVRLAGGRDVLPLTRSQRVSNRRFKEATGWHPSVVDAAAGWALIGAAIRDGGQA